MCSLKTLLTVITKSILSTSAVQFYYFYFRPFHATRKMKVISKGQKYIEVLVQHFKKIIGYIICTLYLLFIYIYILVLALFFLLLLYCKPFCYDAFVCACVCRKLFGQEVCPRATKTAAAEDFKRPEEKNGKIFFPYTKRNPFYRPIALLPFAPAITTSMSP